MKSFEFSQQSTRPIDRNIYEHESEAGSVIETRALLGELDEGVLRDIFARELEKSGVSADKILEERFVPFDEVIVDGIPNVNLGEYDLQTGGVTVFSSTIEKQSSHQSSHSSDAAKKERFFSLLKSFRVGYIFTEEGRSLKNFADYIASHQAYDQKKLRDVLFKIETVHVLVHEQLHAVSHQESGVGTSEEGSFESGKYLRNEKIGVATQRHSYRENPDGSTVERIQNMFNGLNEGMTELIATRLAKEFMKRAPVDGINSGNLDMYYAAAGAGYYERERWVSELLVLLYSVVTDVPEENVLQTMTRTYLSGEAPVVPTELVDAAGYKSAGIEKVINLFLRLESLVAAGSYDQDADTTVLTVFNDFVSVLPSEKQTRFSQGSQDLLEKYQICKELASE